jgi:hypothetical protein
LVQRPCGKDKIGNFKELKEAYSGCIIDEKRRCDSSVLKEINRSKII